MKKLLPLLFLFAGLPAQADRLPVASNPLYLEECGACHLAFPPQLLDTASWRQVMEGLPGHFGTDASLDPANNHERRRAIADFLDRNGGGRKTGVTADAQGKPLLRITETAYFHRKHRNIAPATFERAAIKSAANCTACHAGAADGNYSERAVRMPR